MSDDTRTEYVAWWSMADSETDEHVFEDMQTETYTNDDGDFVFFDDVNEAEAAASEGVIVVECETSVPRASFDRSDIIGAPTSRL